MTKKKRKKLLDLSLRFMDNFEAILVFIAIIFIGILLLLVQIWISQDEKEKSVKGAITASVVVKGKSICGNNVLEDGELCDKSQLNNKKCTDFKFDAGNLTCNPNCTFNLSKCIKETAVCGNDVIDQDEECDGINFNKKDCKSFNYDSGYLLCNENCSIDASNCYSENSNNNFNNNDLDSDLDGMPDWWEKIYGLNIFKDDSKEDPDDDGFNNLYEFLHSTNPIIANKNFTDLPQTGNLKKNNNNVIFIVVIVILGLMLGSLLVFFVFLKKRKRKKV